MRFPVQVGDMCKRILPLNNARLPATVAKPGGLANAFHKNNSKFVITTQSVDSVLVHAVKIVTTRQAWKFTVITVSSTAKNYADSTAHARRQS